MYIGEEEERERLNIILLCNRCGIREKNIFLMYEKLGKKKKNNLISPYGLKNIYSMLAGNKLYFTVKFV